MPAPLRRRLVALIPLLLLATCGPTDHRPWETARQRREHLTATLLNQRMAVQLAGDLAAGRAALQPLLNGTRVTFLDTAQAPGGPTVSDVAEGSVRSSLVEALLDPTLMRISLTDTSELPDAQRAERIENLSRFLQDYRLGPLLVPPADAASVMEAPNGEYPRAVRGLTITISVHCPDRHDGAGYGSGVAKPACY